MNKQVGTSLIEILVTILITGVGLLGLSSMQVWSLKNTNNTQYRTLATFYAYDMAERMRSNKVGVDSGQYNNIDGTETDPACAPCSPAQVAQLHAFEWNAQLDIAGAGGGLPNALGTVVAEAGDIFRITVTWAEQDVQLQGAVNASINPSFVLRVRI